MEITDEMTDKFIKSDEFLKWFFEEDEKHTLSEVIILFHKHEKYKSTNNLTNNF